MNGDVNSRFKYFKEFAENDYLPSTYIGCRAIDNYFIFIIAIDCKIIDIRLLQ